MFHVFLGLKYILTVFDVFYFDKAESIGQFKPLGPTLWAIKV